ncbi:DUF1178 family protein [Donghicola sp. C2-DW-16]|uniref:DUF1178 family protein n=1 Tax=Donghicola mangrovi TaxID=2729614 RepID=A0ABX2PG07_9RHOB|nr:DUF1178 family protein [Donghicola mangrovi]NVO28425.1 DUF1178 family protein [Donghicola mangrovi]
MIRYDLKCADGHVFDSWFQSSSAYDKLAAACMVSCAICGGTKVEKALMAPRVTTSDKAAAPKPQTTAPQPQEAPKLSEPASDVEKALIEMRKHIEKNATYVGGNFAKEARAQHTGEAPERAIYGEAKPEEAKALIEEGVQIAPLPFTPTRKTS